MWSWAKQTQDEHIGEHMGSAGLEERGWRGRDKDTEERKKF